MIVIVDHFAGTHGGAAAMAVIEEAVALHLRANAVIEQLHERPELTNACRGVLRDLVRLGPRSVPQLARRRECSRQHVQVLVNRLVADGMAELVPNPDHRRSPLVSLTGAGRDALEAMWRREAELVDQLPVEAIVGDLRRAAEVLGQLRSMLEAVASRTAQEDER
jgi:DNA-binding MarR family transcriptional regulator